MVLQNIVCNDESTYFQVIHGGHSYNFEIPNKAIIDFLGGMVDCPSFVAENAETFKEIARKAIEQEGSEEVYLVDYETLVDNFN